MAPLNPVLRLSDGRTHRVLGRCPVGISRCAGDVPLALQPFAQFVIRLTDVLAENMSSGSFVLAEIARMVHLISRWRSGFLSRRFAGDDATTLPPAPDGTWHAASQNPAARIEPITPRTWNNLAIRPQSAPIGYRLSVKFRELCY